MTADQHIQPSRETAEPPSPDRIEDRPLDTQGQAPKPTNAEEAPRRPKASRGL